MIFVTAGTDKGFGFDRLVRACDELAPSLPEPVVMQIAFTKYEPKNAVFFRYVPLKEYWSYFEKASLIISHCSSGPILNARRFGKPVIVVPRRHIYNEQHDEHQLHFANTIEERNIPSVKVVYEMAALPQAIEDIRRLKIETYQSTGRNAIIDALRNYVNQNA